MRALGEKGRDVFDNLAQIAINPLKREAAHFALRKVQNVVDHGEEKLRRAVNGLRELSLSWRERRVEQQIRHAHHAIHRRANFVAHVREELGLGAVGLGGLSSKLHRTLARAFEFGRPLLDLGLKCPLLGIHLSPVIAQVLEHQVERTRHLADLIPSSAPHADFEVTLANLLRGVLDLQNGPHEASGEEETRDERSTEREQTRVKEAAPGACNGVLFRL